MNMIPDTLTRIVQDHYNLTKYFENGDRYDDGEVEQETINALSISTMIFEASLAQGHVFFWVWFYDGPWQTEAV